jgi:hypothetical protein
MAHYSGLTVDWMTRKNATSDFNKTNHILSLSPCHTEGRKDAGLWSGRRKSDTKYIYKGMD